MKKNNKVCLNCGKVYTFCPNCSDYALLDSWNNIYCSENCRNIFQITTDYNYGELSKEKALEKLSACDLSNKESFHKTVIKIIDEIMTQTVKDEIEKIKVETSNEVKAPQKIKSARKK